MDEIACGFQYSASVRFFLNSKQKRGILTNASRLQPLTNSPYYNGHLIGSKAQKYLVEQNYLHDR